MLSAAVVVAQKRLNETGLALDHELAGCTEQEIAAIEEQFGLELPASYRDFLKVMGRKAGGFLVGSDYSFPTMIGFRAAVEQMLRRLLPTFPLAPSVFVFFSHQGYNFLWFDCQTAADPPVFLFTELDTEREREPQIVADSFSNWLLDAVEDDIAVYRELGEL